jgi:tetratricopeptide (TPR) repeat protein/NAD-dependent SIR2 family protein deacetylase
MKDISRASIRELAHKIKGYGVPRFAFFLGAGASKQSGILTAAEMIRHFKEQITVQCCPDGLKTDKEKAKWLAEQDWYKADGNEYCKCFERFEPKEIGRQRYIESIIEDREPSFGYVVLANLLASGHINTIITTNFDDLVYSACTTFTDIRPIVYAYGVMASEMRLTAQRPKIFKLHGDYLYSAIKNTGSELANQDPNMERQLKQVLSEYGLIVIGYSGGDESIMKVLSDISERNDLYWCIRRGERINKSVEELLRNKRGYLVEIEGFDEMMNEVRPIVGFDVQKMLGSIDGRRNQITEQLKRFDPQYSAEIVGEIVETIKEPATKDDKDKSLTALDFFVRGYRARKAKDFSKAEGLYRKAIELDPNYAFAYNNLGNMLADLNRYDEAEALLRKAIELNPNDAFAHNNLGNVLLSVNRETEALTFAETAYNLDPNSPHYLLALASIHKKLGHEAESNQYAKQARELFEPDDWYNLVCLESVCGHTDAAIKNLRHAAQQPKFNREWARLDPDLEWIRDDPRFKEVVGEENAG